MTPFAAMRLRKQAFSGPTDPDFANVSMLLHMEGIDTGFTFTDSSSYARVMTRSQTTTSATQKKFGSTSGFFNGNHHVTTVHAAPLDLTTGDFTIELFAFLTAVSADAIMIFKAATTGFRPFELWVDSTRHFRARGWDSTNTLIYNIAAAPVFALNTWYHVALTRNGSTFTLWVDGVSMGTATTSNALFTSASDPVYLGQASTGAASMTGYLDEIRITKGLARYTSAFTPPSAAFPDA